MANPAEQQQHYHQHVLQAEQGYNLQVKTTAWAPFHFTCYSGQGCVFLMVLFLFFCFAQFSTVLLAQGIKKTTWSRTLGICRLCRLSWGLDPFCSHKRKHCHLLTEERCSVLCVAMHVNSGLWDQLLQLSLHLPPQQSKKETRRKKKTFSLSVLVCANPISSVWPLQQWDNSNGSRSIQMHCMPLLSSLLCLYEVRLL